MRGVACWTWRASSPAKGGGGRIVLCLDGLSMAIVYELLVAATDAVFSDQFRKSTEIAKFANEAEKEAYAEKDARLRKLIIKVGERLFNPEFVEEHLFVIWDWWPNHTRYIEASVSGFTQNYFDELQLLLRDEYADWRIEVMVCGNINEGSTVIGSILIRSQQLLIDRAIYNFLTAANFDFHCSRAPRIAREVRQSEELN
jgi:hypothetical protein